MAKDKFAQVKSPLGDKLLFRRMTGREELGRPFSYTVELLSEDEAIKASSLLGRDMTVKVSLEDASDRCINGIVTAFAATGRVGRYMIYNAQLRPWIWLLDHTTDCRIFQKETIPDIIKKVFRDLGFTDIEDGLTATYNPLDYVVQYRETTLNFVTRLMERAGIYYFFKHEEDKHSLVLADSASAHEPAAGYEEVPFYPPDSSHAREHDHFHDWSVQEQFRAGAYAVNDFDFKRPTADLNAKSVSPLDHSKADLELYDYPGEYVEVADGETFAKISLQAQHALHEQVRGNGNARGLSAGHLFKLKGFKRSDQNREYMIVAVDTRLEVKGYESGSGSSLSSRFDSTIVAVESQADYRLPISTPKPVVMGPQTAIVTGKEGEEIWTDEYGRVKLKFHWDRKGKPNEESSCWVRVAQQWAGSGFGSIHIPRIGQEVVVDFLEGDPDRPLVTGRVYNANQKPPHALPGKATQSGIKSRSSKGGSAGDANEIRFEDKKGEEEFYVHAQKDYREVVENDETVEIHRDHKLKIDGSQSIAIQGKHELDGVSGGQLKISGDYKIEVTKSIDNSAVTSITLKCGEASSVKIEPAMITIAVGPSTVRLDPSGVTVTGPTLKLNQ